MSTPGLVSRNARIWSRPVLVRLVVLTMISATALAGLFALQRRVDWQIDIAVAERSQEARLAEAVRYLEDRVAELAEDLDLLADDPRLAAVLERPDRQAIAALAAHYRSVLGHNHHYAGVRLIDADRGDVVRVGTDDPAARLRRVVTPPDRPPTEAWAVEPAAGGILRGRAPVSPLQARLPVRAADGPVAGALAIDIDTDRLLATLGVRVAIGTEPGRLEILRADGAALYRQARPGDGLAPPPPATEAGVGDDRLRAQIGRRDRGSVTVDGELVSFRRAAVGDWLAAAAGQAAPYRFGGDWLDSDWILTIRQPAGSWLAFRSAEERRTALGLAGLALAVLLVINGFVSGRLADREHLLARLKARDRQFRDLEANVRGVFFQSVHQSDGSLAFRYISPSMSGLYGIAGDLDAPTPPTVHPDDQARWDASLQDAARTLADWDFEGRFVLPDDSVRWWRGVARPMTEAGQVVFNGVFVDINDAKQREMALIKAQELIGRQAEALRHLSEIDELTGAVNRRLLMRRLESEAARAVRYRRPLSLAILDVDHFKAINDRLGHDVGDLALSQLVETCHRTVREQDTVARLGGEEFAVLLPETGIDAALQSIERLRVAIQAQRIAHPTATFAVTCSIGLAELADGEGVGALIRRADQALYRAKRAGRNRTITADAPDHGAAEAPKPLLPPAAAATSGPSPSVRLASACQPAADTA